MLDMAFGLTDTSRLGCQVSDSILDEDICAEAEWVDKTDEGSGWYCLHTTCGDSEYVC